MQKNKDINNDDIIIYLIELGLKLILTHIYMYYIIFVIFFDKYHKKIYYYIVPKLKIIMVV